MCEGFDGAKIRGWLLDYVSVMEDLCGTSCMSCVDK